jgi:hypothetical protein
MSSLPPRYENATVPDSPRSGGLGDGAAKIRLELVPLQRATSANRSEAAHPPRQSPQDGRGADFSFADPYFALTYAVQRRA